jgi:hypothetical protein
MGIFSIDTLQANCSPPLVLTELSTPPSQVLIVAMLVNANGLLRLTVLRGNPAMLTLGTMLFSTVTRSEAVAHRCKKLHSVTPKL